MTTPCLSLSRRLAALLLLGCSTSVFAQPASPPPVSAALNGPGVSAELAARRRATLSDVQYALQLTVGTGDSAQGRVVVTFANRGTGDVLLDFRGLQVGAGEINGTAWDAAAAWNRHHVTIPGARLRTGQNVVAVTFASPIASAGAAIIRTRDLTDSSTYLYTLLVPSDANLLFPVFDQPDLKARLQLSLTTPAAWRALANGLAERRDSTGTQVTHHFRETAPISTYLMAFAAGPWHRHERRDALVDGGPPQPMSLYVRQSRAREAESDTLLAMNARALRWLGAYFGVPYPFGKYDALLAPAFPFGGMEHPGAVFYNEESFIYREPPTMSQLLGRQATTFHEVAHQWFGDYVTMQWFDDLWLKEGFATFMAARMQAALEPQANAWKTFHLRNKPVAYATDATAGTTPVWQSLANLDQAKSNYGPIVYNKAPSLLRQLEYLVGDDAFQRGVQQFLKRHAFGNATWQALLETIGTASGRDLSNWGKHWMLRPGLPVVSQQLEIANGKVTRLRLVQRPAQPALSGQGAWPLKVQVLLHYANRPAVRIPIEMTRDTTELTAARGLPAPDLVFANDGDYGYALVLPDARSAAWLESHISAVSDDLLRAQLWGAMWDLVREAQFDPRRFAAMALSALPQERDEQISATLVARMVTSATRYVAPAVRDSLLPAVQQTLARGAADASRPYGQRKTQLDAWIGVARSGQAMDSLRAWIPRDSVFGLALRAPTKWAMVQQLVARGATDATTLVDNMRVRDRTTEGERQAFVARAGIPSSYNKSALFSQWFNDRALNEEWVTSSLRTFFDGDQQALTAPFLIPALDTLPWIQQNRRIFFLGSWLSAVIGGQRTPDALQRIDAWLAAHPTLAPDLRQKILQSRDELERTVRIVRTNWKTSSLN